MSGQSLTSLVLGAMHGDPIPPAPAAPDHVIAENLAKQEQLVHELGSALRVGTWIVEYKKVNGDAAVMECTLDPKLLPQADPSAAPKTSKGPKAAGLLSVYATDRDGWRSFYVGNVTKFYKKMESL